jgi:hypothetical protein
MTRLTSISERILTIASKKSAGGVAYGTPWTSADFSSQKTIVLTAATSQTSASSVVADTTWTINTTSGIISINTKSFPRHTYGIGGQGPIDTTSTHIQTWSYRAGTNTGTSTAIVPKGQIGYWLNGVQMYSARAPRSPYSYSTLTTLTYNFGYQITQDVKSTTPNYTWYGDGSGGWPEPDGRYHYTDYNFEQAWLYGAGHVNGTAGSFVVTDTEVSLINYLGGTMYAGDGHSKLLGFAYDGYPVYGPKGYSNPLDATSGVRYITSGYEAYVLPQQVTARVTAGATDLATYPMGVFCEDYHYTAAGDLDASNGRYCVTPDFPNGTYAYFCSVDGTTGLPTYPYVLGATYRAAAITTSTNTTTNGGGIMPIH